MNTNEELLVFLGLTPTPYLLAKVNKQFQVYRTQTNPKDIERVFKYIAFKHNLDLEILFGKCRKTGFVKARQEGAYLALKLGAKLVEVGRFLKKNHSTILYYRDYMNDVMSIDAKYRKEILTDYELLSNEAYN
jgi:chromosomal replication initiation ATPase DnaA